jgi:hypothetical protein
MHQDWRQFFLSTPEAASQFGIEGDPRNYLGTAHITQILQERGAGALLLEIERFGQDAAAKSASAASQLDPADPRYPAFKNSLEQGMRSLQTEMQQLRRVAVALLSQHSLPEGTHFRTILGVGDECSTPTLDLSTPASRKRARGQLDAFEAKVKTLHARVCQEAMGPGETGLPRSGGLGQFDVACGAMLQEIRAHRDEIARHDASATRTPRYSTPPQARAWRQVFLPQHQADLITSQEASYLTPAHVNDLLEQHGPGGLLKELDTIEQFAKYSQNESLSRLDPMSPEYQAHAANLSAAMQSLMAETNQIRHYAAWRVANHPRDEGTSARQVLGVGDACNPARMDFSTAEGRKDALKEIRDLKANLGRIHSEIQGRLGTELQASEGWMRFENARDKLLEELGGTEERIATLDQRGALHQGFNEDDLKILGMQNEPRVAPSDADRVHDWAGFHAFNDRVDEFSKTAKTNAKRLVLLAHPDKGGTDSAFHAATQARAAVLAGIEAMQDRLKELRANLTQTIGPDPKAGGR